MDTLGLLFYDFTHEHAKTCQFCQSGATMYNVSDKPDRIQDTLYTLAPVYLFFTLFPLFLHFVVDNRIRWVYSIVVTVINPSNWSKQP
jgi:hypothetical protein